jgi:stage V sporulation protein AB
MQIENRRLEMLIRHVILAFASFCGGAAIAGGYFAFISLIGIFPKLAEKIKGNRHFILLECLLAYGATLANIIYIFNIEIPITIIGLAFITFFGGIFVGCLASALAEVLNIFPIISRRFNIRRKLPYVMYAVGLGKVVGSIIGIMANGLI